MRAFDAAGRRGAAAGGYDKAHGSLDWRIT
jgi:hypothetical protein